MNTKELLFYKMSYERSWRCLCLKFKIRQVFTIIFSKDRKDRKEKRKKGDNK